MLSVTFYLWLYWVSLYWLSLYWVSLYWVSLYRVLLYWVSLCWVSHFIYDYTECCYNECRYTECHYTECHCTECRYTECRYAECRYTEWRGAVFINTRPVLNLWRHHICLDGTRLNFILVTKVLDKKLECLSAWSSFYSHSEEPKLFTWILPHFGRLFSNLKILD
jgi:hypothetical protein